MFENIAFIVMIVIALGAGIWVWWLENHDSNNKPQGIEENEK